MASKLVVVSPVYNEEKYLEKYLDSVVKQTKKPDLLIMVDDNSTDNSSTIIKKYSSKYNWIKYKYHRSNNYKRQGGKVIRAFNYGLKSVKIDEYDYISKIDSDLTLPMDYFESIISYFESNLSAGLCGGYCLIKKGDKYIKESYGTYHVRGALKTYRKESFNQMNGLKAVRGWDGLDAMELMYNGWKVKTLDISVIHHRPSSSDYNELIENFRRGRSQYIRNIHLILIIIKGLSKFIKKPYILSGSALIIGYLYAYFAGDRKVVDENLGKFINKFHFKRIFNRLNINIKY